MFHSGDIWHSKASESESESEVAQSCPTLCNPVDCSLPGSPVHGILQARILEWVAMPSSPGSLTISSLDPRTKFEPQQ